MSSGHRHLGGFGINSQVLDRYLKNESIQHELYKLRKISKEFTIPYLGGYSLDGNTIYFDKHLPDKIKLERDGQTREIDPIPFLMRHETFEKTMLDQMHFHYQHAHQLATAYERRGVLEMIGPGWWGVYQRAFDPYIKADAHEKLTKIPSDLDLEPYKDEHDTELLEHLEALMSGKAQKKKSHTSSRTMASK